MAQPYTYGNDGDAFSLYQAAMLQRAGGAMRGFDEYYRCYPIAMLPGPERESANHGGKVFLPASALEKLTRLHITYPMLFKIINGRREKQTHAGVLEFIAEEGKIYLPYWLMQTVNLEAGDLVQVKSTDLAAGSFIKLQPQSSTFLDISDPRAVLENAFRNFACLTKGDVFSFAYNDNVYEMEVLEVKPDTDSHAIYTMETDLSVDFAPPVDYQEPEKPKKAQPSTSSSVHEKLVGGTIHPHGSMAKSINWDTIKPSSSTPSQAATVAHSHFHGDGHKVSGRRTGRSAIPDAASATTTSRVPTLDAGGPQPLRLAPNILFFGYEYVPPRHAGANLKQEEKPRFQGIGQTLRGKKVDTTMEQTQEKSRDNASASKQGHRLGRKKRGEGS